jgi:hypothetical protein
MNERIRDLAIESIVKNITAEDWTFTDEELEKFTEAVRQDVLNQIVITTNASTNEAFLVSLMDEEHRILEILWEKP